MVTTGLTWTDVTVKDAGRGAWRVRAHGPPGPARLYVPQELPSTQGTWLSVL